MNGRGPGEGADHLRRQARLRTYAHIRGPGGEVAGWSCRGWRSSAAGLLGPRDEVSRLGLACVVLGGIGRALHELGESAGRDGGVLRVERLRRVEELPGGVGR